MTISDLPPWPAGNAADPALADDAERLPLLAAHGPDSLEDDAELTRITQFAAQLCKAPVALVTLVEAARQRFLARTGLEETETPRSTSFCAHAMLGAAPMVVPDAAADPRFKDNPLVTGEMGLRFYAGAPLISAEGAPLGALCVIDTVPRPEGLDDFQREGLEVLAQAVMRRLASRRLEREAQASASGQAMTMRQVADLLPDVLWSVDGDGHFDFFNGRWAEITGAPHPKVAEDWRPVIHPDDVSGVLAAWGDSFAAGQPFESEHRLRRADGSWRWTMSRAVPQIDARGRAVRWFGMLTDVDEGHKLAESRELLARELSHRIKNIFAVVSGLVAIRARGRPEATAFSEEITSAIRALGRAHDFVRPGEGAHAPSLKGLLNELMAPYANASCRVDVAGEDCQVGPRAATPLALVFHELATNSAKYGALSVDGGAVDIAIDCAAEPDKVRIAWRETGGPAASPPETEGFGSRLVKMSVEGQLSGAMERRFPPGGLELDLTIPRVSITT